MVAPAAVDACLEEVSSGSSCVTPLGPDGCSLGHQFGSVSAFFFFFFLLYLQLFHVIVSKEKENFKNVHTL